MTSYGVIDYNLGMVLIAGLVGGGALGIFEGSTLARPFFFIFSAIFAMLSVYAVTMNLSIFEVSILLVGVTLSGAFFQWPIGFLSDSYDRRIIIVGCCIAACIFAFMSIAVSGVSFKNLFIEFSLFIPITEL